MKSAAHPLSFSDNRHDKSSVATNGRQQTAKQCFVPRSVSQQQQALANLINKNNQNHQLIKLTNEWTKTTKVSHSVAIFWDFMRSHLCATWRCGKVITGCWLLAAARQLLVSWWWIERLVCDKLHYSVCHCDSRVQTRTLSWLFVCLSVFVRTFMRWLVFCL